MGKMQKPAKREQRGKTTSRQTVKRILVADDEHLVAEGMARSLSALGYEVVGTVANGEQAIEMTREQNPDMAILDIRMPKVDGLTAAEILTREMDLAILIATAYSDESYLKNSCQVGVHGYILKPISTEQLRVAVTMAWSRYQQEVGLNTEVTRLRLNLEQRRKIEQAKWVLVKKLNIEEEEAHRKLQKYARDSRKPVVEIASSILDNEAIFSTESGTSKKS